MVAHPMREHVPASAHFPVGYNHIAKKQLGLSVPASAHFPVGYNCCSKIQSSRSVPASAHFPVGYNRDFANCTVC